MVLVACGSSATNADLAGFQATARTITAVAAADQTASTGWFAVDSLVRSEQLPGVDLHVRYAERTPTALTLHLAFYNNSPNDLAFVQGVQPMTARLVGAAAYAPTAASVNFQNGAAPEGTWVVNGAANGTLQFPPIAETSLRFVLEGFPPVALRWTLPLMEPPELPTAPPGSYRWDYSVAAVNEPQRILRLVSATLSEAGLDLVVVLPDDEPATDVSDTLVREAILLDGRWNQLRPAEIQPSEDDEIVLRFSRPMVGHAVLLRLPSFPLLYVPLLPDLLPRLATVGDLPPAAAPRLDNELAQGMADPTPVLETTPAPARGQSLLDQLNAALQARDRAAYLQLFAPDLQAAQGLIFDQSGTLPLIAVQWVSMGDSSDSAARELPVTLRYYIGEKSATTLFRHDLRFQLDASSKRITAITGDLPFWATAPPAAQQTGPFWIFFDPALHTELPSFTRALARAFSHVDRALPDRASPPYIVFLAASRDEFTALTGRAGDQWGGAALGRYLITAAGVSTSNHMIVLNATALDFDDEDRERTLAHELTHLVLAPATMPFTPAWLVEGAAMVVAADVPTETLRLEPAEAGLASIDLLELSARTSFGHDDDTAQTLLHYHYAAHFATFLIESYGLERFLALYDSFQATDPRLIQEALANTDERERSAALGRLAQQLLPALMDKTFGADLETLEQRFRKSVNSE